MRSRIPAGRSGILVFACVLVLSRPVGTAAGNRESPCSNFAQVDVGLYRGAEPGDACLEHAAAIGIRTVINLRDEKDAGRLERDRVTSLGLRYLSLPMSGFASPRPEEVERVLKEVRAQENRPVFVHCKRGSDRTGVIVAAYRMTDQAWPIERALEEAREFGMGWWQVRMKRFIQEIGQRESVGGAGER